MIFAGDWDGAEVWRNLGEWELGWGSAGWARVSIPRRSWLCTMSMRATIIENSEQQIKYT